MCFSGLFIYTLGWAHIWVRKQHKLYLDLLFWSTRLFSGSAQPLVFFIIFIVKCEKKLMMKSSKVIGPSKSIEGHAAERKMLAHSLRFGSNSIATRLVSAFHKRMQNKKLLNNMISSNCIKGPSTRRRRTKQFASILNVRKSWNFDYQLASKAIKLK